MYSDIPSSAIENQTLDTASGLQSTDKTASAPSTRSAHANAPDLQATGQKAAQQFAARRDGDARRSTLQFVTTFVPFLVLLGIMTASVNEAYWLTLLLAVPAAGLLVRLFIFQHDCGHGSFFKSRWANDALGRFISIFTLTPYDQWRHYHALHHATSGNLDKRGLGDVPTMTVTEYLALPPLQRFGYRVFRHPVFMIAFAIPLNFIFLQRIPIGRDLRNGPALRSILGLNLMLLVFFGGAIAVIGAKPVLAAFLPVIIIGSAIGGWLFYVQHQFEDAYWRREGNWNFHEAAASGSSYYDLPPILKWFTGNIGLHHIHHLCSRIPNYRLQECFDAFPELNVVAKRITLNDSLDCWKYALWDEDKNSMVGFSELH